MFDLSQAYHTGIRVLDIDAAMADLAAGFDVSWATVQHFPNQDIWTPEGGLVQTDLVFTYSIDGPVHLELVQGGPGTVLSAGDAPGIHHLGFWVDDVPAAVDRCTAAGWQLVAATRPPEDGFGTFAYLAPPSGLVVEVVSSMVRPAFEAWWAGARLGGERD